MRAGGAGYSRRVHVVLSHHDARRVQRPVDLVGQRAFEGDDGMMQPPQVPRLHVAVLSCCRQQVTEAHKELADSVSHERRRLLPGGGAEGQSSDGVVVSQEASIGQQGERLVLLPHSQQRRLGGQIPQSNHTWKRAGSPQERHPTQAVAADGAQAVERLSPS